MTDYDLIIVGAGVSGSAVLYMCTKYTDIKKILVVEKYDKPAQVNSLPSHNSQTLHCGDIETNYSLDKALIVRRSAMMVRNYALAQDNTDELIFKYPKMVLGVGEDECNTLRERWGYFSEFYPNLKLMNVADIACIEPWVAINREEEILALGSTNEYTAVDFEALAQSFMRQASIYARDNGKIVDTIYDHEVKDIISHEDHHEIVLKPRSYTSRATIVCAGGHSLELAHKSGHGLKYSVLPIAGSYYYTPKRLGGKVYTVQNDKLPFAAVHGDPDIKVPGITRFGPTALVLPLLERYNYKTMIDFFRVFQFDKQVIKTLWRILSDSVFRNYMLRNLLFEIPLVRRKVFLKDAQKIIPSLELKDIKFAKKVGGIRPQLIDKERETLVLGEAKIQVDNGMIFNITPSPGGTSCLDNAEVDMRQVAKHLGASIDEDALKRELLDESSKFIRRSR